ncbi:MAG: hypothetical protein ACHP8A_17445, partial [Terriglobales bacterium]
LECSVQSYAGIFRCVFVRYPDGNSRVAAGTHDDRVMAMAIALGVRQRDVGRKSGPGWMGLSCLPRG